MTLLICPVRPGDKNEELRYAMRSWETHLLAGRLDLVTVGYKPSWLSPDHHIEGNRFESLPLAVWDNVYQGALAMIPEDQVIFMNDDFFCMDPVPGVTPVKRNMSLAEHRSRAGTGWWGTSLDLTASWLADQGYPSPDSYETHRPLLAPPDRMVWALERFPIEGQDVVPQWRTIYGVLNGVDATPVPDVKLGGLVTGVGSAWISTSDSSWRKYGRGIMTRFQKPSRWEN